MPTSESAASYVGNGVATTFPVGFEFRSIADVVVYLTAPLGPRVLQSYGTRYTISGLSVVFVVPPPAGHAITIERDVEFVQPTDFRNFGPFSPSAHEDQFDRVVFMAQQLARRVDALETFLSSGGQAAASRAEIISVQSSLTSLSTESHLAFADVAALLVRVTALEAAGGGSGSSYVKAFGRFAWTSAIPVVDTACLSAGAVLAFETAGTVDVTGITNADGIKPVVLAGGKVSSNLGSGALSFRTVGWAAGAARFVVEQNGGPVPFTTSIGECSFIILGRWP